MCWTLAATGWLLSSSVSKPGGLIHSWCNLQDKGEANLLKLLEVRIFSVASVMMLSCAAPPELIVSRSLPVTACRRRHFAPRVKQTPVKCQPTAGPEIGACGGCVFENGKQIGADYAAWIVVQKVSDLILNLNVVNMADIAALY